MATRPISYPQWVDSGPNVIQPAAELAATGYVPTQAPDAQNFNWLFGNYNDWIQYLDQLTNTGIPMGDIRLINGGNWSFNASSGVLAWDQDANLAIPSLTDASNDIPAGSVTMADGQIAYINANLPTYSQGNTSTTSNPNEITGMNFTGNISFGDAVTGPGIPSNTTVTGVGADFVTLSNNVTSNNVGATYTFAPVGSLTVHVVNNTALIPTIGTILLARRAGNVIYLGVNCAQMVLRDGEFKTLIGSGYFSLYQAPAGQNLSAGTLCYISPGSSDGGRTAGALYPLDTSAANQAVRGVYAGVVITTLTTGQTATVLYSGFYKEVGLTPGAFYYADPTTPGGITPNVPTGAGQRVEPIGFAVTSTSLLLTGVAAGVTAPLLFPIFSEDKFVGNNSNTAFPLSTAPLSPAAIRVFAGGVIVPNSEWSFASQTVTFTAGPPGMGVAVIIRYLDAGQNYLSANQEQPINPSGDFQTFVLQNGLPTSKAAVDFYVNRVLIDSALYSLVFTGTGAEIVTNAPLAPGQVPYVTYFTAAQGQAGSGSGYSVTGIPSPQVVNPSVGIVINPNAQRQLIVLVSQGGAQNITANPQIQPGTIVGQELVIEGSSATDYPILANGNGVDINGPLLINKNANAYLYWNGSVWREISRR